MSTAEIRYYYNLFHRAETILSSLIVRPDSQDPNSTNLTMLLQNDAKGLLPKFVVNLGTTRSPDQWRESLAKYYTDVYSKQ